MRKLTALLLLSAFMCIQAFANPAIRGLVQMPQPDGTLVSIRLVGDEFYSFNTTDDDYTVLLNENGAYVYAQREGTSLVPTTVLAHDEGQRDATELALLSTLNKRMTDRVAVEQANVRRVKRNVDLSNFDFENFRGLVILVDFSDKHFEAENPQAFYTEMFSTEGLTGWRDPHTGMDVTCPGSVRDYFNDQSNGAFNPPFDVYGPITTSYKANQCYYNSSTIFREVLSIANSFIDFNDYDKNNDGKVDMVFFLVAGYSAAANGSESGYLWPHASNLSPYYINYDGKLMDRYASSAELYGWESSPSTVVVEGIGTVCHEISHVLGLPDFYDTDYEGSGGESHTPGGWDVMAGGSDYNYGRTPAGYTFFERYALGWANPKTINREGNFSLEAVNVSGEGYILRTPVENEFFTIENRQKTGWDAYIPGHGMIVTRVDSTNLSMWGRNKVNCNPAHNYLEMLRAGNTTSGDLGSDPFPGTLGNPMLTNTTEPNLKTWAGNPNEYNIVNINEDNGIINFTVTKEGSLQTLVEDFEGMDANNNTNDEDVQGLFTSWSFNRAGVRAPGEGQSYGENSVMMNLGSQFFSTSPIYYNINQAYVTVFNNSDFEATYSLEYSIDNGETWISALTPNNGTTASIPDRTVGICYWNLNLNNRQGATFRITQVGGNMNTDTYIDNFTLIYTGVQGIPNDHIGDINEDGEINITDVIALIRLVLESAPIATEHPTCDINSDGEINIGDITMLISQILNQPD